jgi:hypothetical protein
VDATGAHVEADAAVGGDAELEIGDGDHHVVDARQHGLDQEGELRRYSSGPS